MAGEIIGRREELLALEAFLGAVPAGGQALLLEGDAGIGKSALWYEGLRLARERGFRVLTARAARSETQVAFGTVGDLFAPVLDATLPRLVPVQRRALEIALGLRASDGRPPDARLLGLALVSVVRALAEDGPILVAVDDVQWVDASSAEVLRFVLWRLEGEPVGVLATVRQRPVEAPLELDRAFGSFRRMTIGPLSVGAIHRVLWGRLALNLPRPFLLRVHDIAGGNPFFALELGRGLVDGRIRADGTDVALPESLVALVTERLRALPTCVRETLVAVAALAAPSVVLLEALGPAVVRDIEFAQSRGVVELDGDRIRFTHPLLAPACYTGMPLHRRRRLHRHLAELDVDPEERARHLAIATSGSDEEIAAALDVAARHASGRGAAQAAAELAERAIDVTPRDKAEAVNRRRITAARLCLYAGDGKKARALLEKAVGALGPGPLRGEALNELGRVRLEEDGFRACQNVYLIALAEPGLGLRQKVDMLSELAVWAVDQDGARYEAPYLDGVLALAEELGDPKMLAFSLGMVADLTFWLTGRMRRDLLDRGLELERAAGGLLKRSPRRAEAFLLERSDRFDESRATLRSLIADGAERDDPDVAWDLFCLARLEVTAGAWDEAVRLCDEAAEVARQTGWGRIGPSCQMLLAEVDAYRGDAEKARREIPELIGIAKGAGHDMTAMRLERSLALLDLACGDPVASWGHIAERFAPYATMNEDLARLAGSLGIELAIAGGDLPAAERLLTPLDARVAEGDAALRPLALRSHGLLLAERGDTDGAIAALEAAAEEPEPPQLVNPFELARTILALGIVQRRAQHKRAARESLERAGEIFEQLGARLWLEKARSELRRIGGRTAPVGELSETERRIVELVVAGRRNREVAAELSLSPNTVAWNLKKVYRKLGVSSRTELAAHISATPRA